MPSAPKPGMRYYQEIAPGVAMDRAEIVSLTETCTTRPGTFPDCIKVKEGAALEFWATEYKHHAPASGSCATRDLELVSYGRPASLAPTRAEAASIWSTRGSSDIRSAPLLHPLSAAIILRRPGEGPGDGNKEEDGVRAEAREGARQPADR